MKKKTLHLDLEIQTQNVEDATFELFLEDGIRLILEKWGGSDLVQKAWRHRFGSEFTWFQGA